MKNLLEKGFTLLELLVVIVLLGLLTSFMMLSINISGLESELDEEANKIYALIRLAKEEAIIQAKEIALAIDKQSYVFMELKKIVKNNKEKYIWEPVNNKIFRERKLHPGLEIRMETKEEYVFQYKDKRRKLTPTIFSSTGEQSEFILNAYIKDNKNNYYKIDGKINGDIAIEKITNDDF